LLLLSLSLFAVILHLLLIICIANLLLFSYSATRPQVWNKAQCQCQEKYKQCKTQRNTLTMD